MKKSLLIKLGISLILLVGFAPFGAGQTNLASWSFDALLAASDAVPTASVINADDGILAANATIYLNGTNGSSSWISVTSNPELTTFSGSTLNDPRTVPNAGMALALANLSANGKSVIFKFSTLGYQNISLSFATRGTSTGFNTHSWEWSTDNVTYTAFGTNTANMTSTFTLKTLDLSGIPSVNNALVVYIKLTLSGATSAAGNNRIENFIVNGIAPDITAPNPIFSPANAANNVAVSVIPTITFDEAIFKTGGSPVTDGDLSTLVTFKKTDASGADVPFTATIDAARKIITVTPSAALDNSQAYYLAVGPVEDIIGNESTLKSATFTTIGALTPTITVTYPNGGEVMYAGDLKTITWTTTNFDVAENVKIEVWAIDGSTGNYFWLTLEASTPNDGAYDVIVGTDAPYGTDYRIKLSGVTNGAVDESNGPFTVISAASDLATLRTYPVNTIIKYTGVATVTYARTFYNQKYIQDATAAILIHDPTTAPGYITGTYNIGDGITNVEGKITLYNGLIELVPQATTGEHATGPAIVPPVVDITSLTSADQCKLVKVQNLQFSIPTQWDVTGLYVAGKNYDLAGLSNVSYAYRTNFSESDYIGTPVPIEPFDAIVLVGQYNAQMQVTARSSADITLLPTGIEETLEKNIRLYPVPASTELAARNIQNVKSIEILDVTGKVVMTIDANNRNEIRIPVSNLANGMYFIKFTTDKGKIIRRFIKD